MAQVVYEAIIEQDSIHSRHPENAKIAFSPANKSPTATNSQRRIQSAGSHIQRSARLGRLDCVSLPGQLDCDHQGDLLHGETGLQIEAEVSLGSTTPSSVERNLPKLPSQSTPSEKKAITQFQAIKSQDEKTASSPIVPTATDRKVPPRKSSKSVFVFPQYPQLGDSQPVRKALPAWASQIPPKVEKLCAQGSFDLSSDSIGSDSVFTIERTHNPAGLHPERSQTAGLPILQNKANHLDVVSLPGQVNQNALPLDAVTSLLNRPRELSLASDFSFHSVAFDPQLASSKGVGLARNSGTTGLDSVQHGVLESGLSDRTESLVSVPDDGSLSTVCSTVPLVGTELPKTRWSSKLASFLCNLICILTVYPVFFTLLPFLVVFKLLFCCIPCRRFRTISAHLSPFFASKLSGTYYYTLVVFKESMSFETFCSSLASVLNRAYLQSNTRVLSLKLAAVLSTKGCFSCWRTGDDSDLGSHLHLVDRKMTTVNDLSNYIAELSNSEPHEGSSLWAAYFIPTYIGRSAVVVKTHHCLASGANLKDTFLRLLDTDRPKLLKPTFPIRRVSKLAAVLKAPAVFIRHLLHSTLLNDLHPLLLNGSASFIYSAPYELEPIQSCASHHGVTVGTVFLSCLTGAIRKLLLQGEATASDMPFALPVTIDSRLSFFSVDLPVSEECPIKQLFKTNDQLLLHGEEAFTLLSTARLASIFLCSSAIDSVSNAMLRKVTGIFSVIDLSDDPLYFDSYTVSSIICWPPRYSSVSLSVTIVCYKQTFRICVATDKNVSEWPDILMSLFIASCSDLVKSL